MLSEANICTRNTKQGPEIASEEPQLPSTDKCGISLSSRKLRLYFCTLLHNVYGKEVERNFCQCVLYFWFLVFNILMFLFPGLEEWLSLSETSTRYLQGAQGSCARWRAKFQSSCNWDLLYLLYFKMTRQVPINKTCTRSQASGHSF